MMSLRSLGLKLSANATLILLLKHAVNQRALCLMQSVNQSGKSPAESEAQFLLYNQTIFPQPASPPAGY